MPPLTWHLADCEAVIALFCEGITGRYLHIKSSQEFDSPTLKLADHEAMHTEDSLYLPPTLRAYDRSAYRVLALIQIGYRECGTYQFSFERLGLEAPKLKDRIQIHALHQDVAMSRRGDLSRLYLCFDNPGLARNIFLLLEYARVLTHIQYIYPGVKPHLRQYFSYLNHTTAPLHTPLADGQRTLQGDRQAARRLPPHLKQALTELRHPRHPVYKTVALLFDVYEELSATYPALDLPRSAKTDASDWLQREQRLQQWEDALEALDRQPLAVPPTTDDEIATRNEAGIHGAVHETLSVTALQQTRNDLARRIANEQASVAFVLGKSHSNSRSARYDEWNYLEQRYLKRWCRVYEMCLSEEQAATDSDQLQQIIRRWQPIIKKHLADIRPMGLQRIRRVTDGDELDMNAIIDARQDIRSRCSPKEHFYSRKQRLHRDVCAAFLVDLSASTDDPIDPLTATGIANPESKEPTELADPLSPWPEWDQEPPATAPSPPTRRVIDIQREAMAVMAAALDDLGDSYGIYGFSGYGKDHVEMFTAKTIAQPFTQRTLRTIAAMQPKRSTRMGAAIRHTTSKLLTSGQALKLLLVLSDGFPQDCDYGPERGEHEYGVQDTAKALQEARQKSIETFCITVDRSGHDYLKRMCSPSRYLVIEEIEDLPQAVSKVYAALTGR